VCTTDSLHTSQPGHLLHAAQRTRLVRVVGRPTALLQVTTDARGAFGHQELMPLASICSRLCCHETRWIVNSQAWGSHPADRPSPSCTLAHARDADVRTFQPETTPDSRCRHLQP